jgi:hypothetical protein
MHLTSVAGEQVHAWLAERAADHAGRRDRLAAVVDQEQDRLRALRRALEQGEAQHRRLLTTDPALADSALRQVAKLEAEAQDAERAAGDAAARAAEFADAPDAQAVIDHLAWLSALIDGRLKEARGGTEINAVLREALEGVWLQVSDGVLRAYMRARTGARAQFRTDPQNLAPESAASVWLPEAKPDGEPSSTAGFSRGLPLPPLVVEVGR